MVFTIWRLIVLLYEIFYAKSVDIARIEKQGLLAVKIAQTFALRIDFLPAEKCAELTKLYTQTTSSVPAEDLDELIDDYTSDDWRTHFSAIEPEPFSSASVGQVHKAKLKDGTPVAIKLIKKSFTNSFLQDVRAANVLLKVAIFFYPKLQHVADPQGILKSIKENTVDELDLRLEVEHAEKLKSLREEHGQNFDFSAMKFPKIYKELSGEKVLVTELLTGPTFHEAIANDNVPYTSMLELFKIHGYFLFTIGQFHGDIHPGNIVWQDNNFYFIDTGAFGEISDEIRLGLFRFMANLSEYEFKDCAAALNDMATKKIAGKAYERYEQKFLKLYDDFEGKTVSEISLTKQMMRTIKIGVRSGMRFPQDMYPIIKSMMYLDGMVLRINPDAVLMRDVHDFVELFEEKVFSRNTTE